MSASNPTRREIVLINKTHEEKKAGRDFWGTAEKISKTFSIAAIPVVLAVGGWIIQERLQDRTIRRDYVQLAVSILKEPDNASVKPEMRAWAVQLLNDNSPTRFNAQVSEQLKSGEAQLPASFTLSSNPVPPVENTREDAVNLELKGFQFIVNRDYENALQSFTKAERLWPSYHNVAEIRKLLEQNRSALSATPNEGNRQAWTNLYHTLLSKYSWGMPPDIKETLGKQG